MDIKAFFRMRFYDYPEQSFFSCISAAQAADVINPIASGDFTVLAGRFLQWLLSLSGGVALLMLVIGGMLYMTSAGDPQKAEQGKKIVIWTVAGLLIVLLSYAIISLISGIFV